MKKIMFSDRYGLTQAVLAGRKTMTRRAISEDVWERADVYRHKNYEDILGLLPWKNALIEFSPFKVGEVVAVAQRYKDIRDIIGDIQDGKSIKSMAGWNNKMFVSADFMPNQIRITNVRVERLQDISDDDCKREGLEFRAGWTFHRHRGVFASPREAFAALIDKVSGKRAWESNPRVFVYEFELVK